jgi:hypothetical protein
MKEVEIVMMVVRGRLMIRYGCSCIGIPRSK